MRDGRIHALKDFDAQGLNELWLWLQPRIKDKDRPSIGGAAALEWEDVGVGCGGGGGGGASAMPWCQAQNSLGYGGADFASGRSPNPLVYHFFSTTDATAFAFNTTGSPSAGDGDVRILRSGLYFLRLSVAPSALTHNADPGYNWDIAIRVWGIDAASAGYFGPDFSPSSAYQSGASWAFFESPRDLFVTAGYTSPNGDSRQGAGIAQAPESGVYLNLDDSVVTWPVHVNAQFHHGLNDADITNPIGNAYTLLVVRIGDSNPDAPTG